MDKGVTTTVCKWKLIWPKWQKWKLNYQINENLPN